MNADVLKAEAIAKAKADRELEERFFKNTPLSKLFDRGRQRAPGRPVGRR